jgi:hypothetical protein
MVPTNRRVFMSRQSKPTRPGNEPTLQLSSGQLIIAICLLILAGAGLIALGIMVGRFEQDMRLNDVSLLQSGADALGNIANDADLRTAPDAPSSEGVQTSPRLPMAPVSVDRGPSGTNTRAEEYAAPAPGAVHASSAPDATATPTPSSSVGSMARTETVPPTPVQSAPDEPVAADPVPDELTELEPVPVPDTKETVPDSLPELQPVDLDDLTADPPVPSIAVSPAAPASSASDGRDKGKFAVQVAAVPAGSTDKVDEVVKRHQGENPYSRLSADGKWLRIYIGRFDSRNEALAKQEALRKIPEFKECFIRVLE